jgi:hypothetical protein
MAVLEVELRIQDYVQALIQLTQDWRSEEKVSPEEFQALRLLTVLLLQKRISNPGEWRKLPVKTRDV